MCSPRSSTTYTARLRIRIKVRLCSPSPTDLAVCSHPTAFTKPPFACTNEGWGEFEIAIDLYTTEKTKLAPFIHDLNFQQARYENVQTVVFKNPSQALQERLRETGPLPTDDDRPKKKGALGPGGAVAGKKSGREKFDYEKIAEALEKLGEEDLLRVIQLINENKGPDTYIRSDLEGEFCLSGPGVPSDFHTPSALVSCPCVDAGWLIEDDLMKAGEFSIDLYTMPDLLTSKLWEHLVCIHDPCRSLPQTEFLTAGGIV